VERSANQGSALPIPDGNAVCVVVIHQLLSDLQPLASLQLLLIAGSVVGPGRRSRDDVQRLAEPHGDWGLAAPAFGRSEPRVSRPELV
jgi:hypothetical protein